MDCSKKIYYCGTGRYFRTARADCNNRYAV